MATSDFELTRRAREVIAQGDASRCHDARLPSDDLGQVDEDGIPLSAHTDHDPPPWIETTDLLSSLVAERISGHGRPRVRGLLRAALRCYAFDRASPRWPTDIVAGGEVICG